MKLKFISLLLCFLAMIYALDYLTTISHIVCQIEEEEILTPCEQKLEAMVSEKKGSSLLGITSSNVMIPSQEVNLIKIEKQIPQTLILTFKPKQAIYTLADDFTVFMDGSIGPSSNLEALPKVNLNLLEDDNSQNYVPTQYHTVTLKIIDEFHSAHIEIDKIVWEDENTIVVYTELPQKILLNPKKIPSVREIIPGILQHATYQHEKDKVTEIDLRYSHIILR